MKRVVQLMKRVVQLMGTTGRRAAPILDDPFTTWVGSPCSSETLPMEIAQVKWFLRAFADGRKLNTVVIRELYLSGYIEIELHSPGKEPLPTHITEKGKRVLES
jgi:hypothetical protein